MRSSRLVILTFVAVVINVYMLRAQVVPQAVSLSGEIGSSLYIGEFNSLDPDGSFNPSSGFDIGGGIKYQIASNFALMATVGYTRLAYNVDDNVRLAYGANFFGPLSNRTYPGSTVELTKLNYIDYARYVLFGQSHFNVTSNLVPYFTLGVGVINFTATNGQGLELPKNITGNYSSTSLVMPLGLGMQLYLDPRFSVHGQALFYVNTTDYLDGYADFLDFDSTPGRIGPGAVATPPDYPLTLTIGASYAIYLPEESVPPIAAATPDEQPQPTEQPFDNATPSNADDTDNDGLSDSAEVERFATNPSDPDTDADGLNDYEELFRYNTSPNSADTDRDGLTDGSEVLVHNTDPLDADSDDDMLVDGDEVNGSRTELLYTSGDGSMLSAEVLSVRSATDPLDPDTDNDGVPDGLDACPTTPGEVSLKGCTAMASTDTGEPDVESYIEPGVEPTIDIEDAGAGYRTDFEGITFLTNTDDFDFSRPTTQRDLARLLALAKECDELGLLIEGHTSGEGNPSWNQRLSSRRARRVRDWLAANGVAERNLFGAVGYGSRMPKVAETGSRRELEELRSRNRRITALVRKPCP